MGLIKGGALRIFQSSLYLLEFCCAAIILGIYSYFLAVLSDHHRRISKSPKAIEGISGAACLYLIFAVILTCCLGGISFFAFLGVVLDLLFFGAFIAIAIMARSGAHSCTNIVHTPLGSGPASSETSGYGSSGTTVHYLPHLGTACKLNTAAFAVAIVGAFLFLITAAMQVALVRNHRKEKRFGPSPANNYTSGSGGRNRKFWQRKQKGNVGEKHDATRDAELGAAGVGAAGLATETAHHHDIRPSHDTAYTGSTVTGNHNGHGKDHHLKRDAEVGAAGLGAAGLAHHEVQTHHHNNNNNHQQYASPSGHAPHGAHGGYYTQPQGVGANPYGYENEDNVAGRGGTYLNYQPDRNSGAAQNF